MLFGGGPLQAIGGAVGGNIGERFTPGGGFGGSIAVTAAISSIQQFGQAAREVGNSLKDANLGLQKLEELGYKVDASTKRQVETLLKANRIREAENLVNQKFADIIGPKSVQTLIQLDTAYDELQRETSKLFLILSSELAPTFKTIIDLTTTLSKVLRNLPIKEIVSLINPIVRLLNAPSSLNEINETRKANNVIDFGLAFAGIKPLNKPNLNKNNDLSTGLTDVSSAGGTSGTGSTRSFGVEEINVLNKRIELQKAGNDILNEEVFARQLAVIEAERLLAVAQANGNLDKEIIANKNAQLKTNELNTAVDEKRQNLIDNTVGK